MPNTGLDFRRVLKINKKTSKPSKWTEVLNEYFKENMANQSMKIAQYVIR